MDKFRLSSSPVSIKLLVTSLMCIIGVAYLILVVHIWIDTELKPSMVAEAYGYMEYIELTDHAHFYLPYYSLFIFAIPVVMFMFTSFGEKWKIFFATVPFAVVFVDIASMYLIPYVSSVFAMVLWLAGSCLGTMMGMLFVMLMYDVWLRKA